VFALVFLSTFGFGCSSLLGNTNSNEQATGSADVAITSVPAGVNCIRISVTGTRSVAQTFDVTPNASSLLTMGSLPVGHNMFTGEAFSSACAAVQASSVPTWLSQPTPATVSLDATVSVTLVMTQNGQANVGVDFPAVFDTAVWDNANFN
jgi:hypothetical protein